MECIFCKILNDELPSHKIYEDEFVYAFLDITQGTKGHTLIIPKTHVKNVYELSDEQAKNIFSVVPKISRALKLAFNPIGINIVSNNELPLQSVFHFHIHLVPRYEDDGMILSTINNYGKFSDDYFNELVNKINEQIKKRA